ncbi:adaptin region [Ostertagia ostertagi]
MTDSKYFTTTKKGEIFELKTELNSDKKEKKREAVKKVIASMTVGKDVSALFPDVVNCMQTDNVELKKLVYLYLMNYAKSQPDLAIMAVNTFVKDCEDPNPLIRALAVRTMGCIRVEKITEYLCEPLRKCMKDEDPYVRKTAAVCVAKLHDMNPKLVEEQGSLLLFSGQDYLVFLLFALFQGLSNYSMTLLSDANPMVVANAVAALTEINEQRPLIEVTFSFVQYLVNSQMVNKLLTALNECTEWGQVFILDALAGYRPRDEREAQNICERISPRLAHANAAVVLSTVKVLMKLVDMLPPDSEFINQLTKKLAPPMVTLLSAEPEIQYVALRNINLIVQKRPDILKQEMKVFFVKYNDPIYVKMEKLDIMIRLAQQNNIAQVLSELKEYATEVDVDFVRKSVRAIGRCAIKVETSSERCVATLLELIQTKVNYVVQEAVVVIKDIFRKYPNRYESIISTLCENLDTLDEPEARASMIWIIGEYAERIDNADELLESFVEGFHDENTQVQLQLLTAVVKLFLKRPTDTQQLVQRVLSLATQDSDNPDLRDRGYIYWRLLSADPAAAKQVVLAEKPLISEETDLLARQVLFFDQLSCHKSGSWLRLSYTPTLRSLIVQDNHYEQELASQSMAFLYYKYIMLHVDDVVRPVYRVLVCHEIIAVGFAFVAANLFSSGQSSVDSTGGAAPGVARNVAPTVIPSQDTLIADLLSLDISTPMGAMNTMPTYAPMSTSGGLDDLLGLGGPSLVEPAAPPVASTTFDPLANLGLGAPSAAPVAPLGGLGDIFGGTLGLVDTSFGYQAPKQLWLDAAKAKAMQPLSGFAIQFNRNSFGLAPAEPLRVPSPLMPSQSVNVSNSAWTVTIQRYNLLS